MRPRALFIALALTAGASACSTIQTADPPSPPGTRATGRAQDGSAVPVNGADLTFAAALEHDDSCDALLDRIKAEASKRVTSSGLPGVGRSGGTSATSPATASGAVTTTTPSANEDRSAGAAAAPAAPSAKAEAASPDGGSSGPDFSTTNVQEQGVDEPDVLKSDGRRLFTVVGDTVTAYDVTGGAPRRLSELSFGGGSDVQLLLAGDRLLVMGTDLGGPLPDDQLTTTTTSRNPGDSSDWEPVPDIPVPGPARSSRTSIVTVDVSDPANPRALRRNTIDGQLVSARFTGGLGRLVIASTNAPELAPASGSAGSSSGSSTNSRAIRQRLRDVISASTIEDWLPTVSTVEATGGAPSSTAAPAVDCARVERPKQFAGFGMLSVVTVDPDKGIDPSRNTAVQAAGNTVYASSKRLYVATTGVGDVDPDTGASRSPTGVAAGSGRTAIHAFDISSAGPAAYTGTGEVDGRVLNQFSLSEQDGYLRVATTVSPSGRATQRCNGSGTPSPAARAAASQSQVAVLKEDGGRLRQYGRVDGLGRGEEIKAVRFLGKVGYVVTFCQTDPLYTIDLSDPSNPKKAGELKVLGYSSYLHPAGEGQLIGIGQDATATGRATGTQVALYDVSDPAQPKQVQKYDLPTGRSAAEQDHHAFLWWPQSHLAVLPVQTNPGYGGGSTSPCPPGATCANTGVAAPDPESASPFVGAIGLNIDTTGISERGRIAHASGGDTPTEPGTRCDPACPPRATTAPTATTVPVDPAAAAACRAAGCASPGRASSTSTGVPILRAAVVGTTVYTLSTAGLQANDLVTLERTGWAER